jgi:hypothetical protein
MRVHTIGEERISSTLISARCNHQPLTISKTKEVIENEVILPDQRRGESGLTPSIHPQTINRILKDINASVECGKSMTNAT